MPSPPAVHRSSLARLMLAPLALLTACGDEPRPQTAEDTITYTLQRLSREEDPGVFWDLLPLSYHKDIHDWSRRLATELPGKTYDKLFLALRKTGIVIKKQSEKLLNFAPLRYMMAMSRGADEDDMIAMLNAIGNIPILLGKSEIASLAKLGTADIGHFLHDTGAKIWQQVARAYRVTGNTVGSTFANLTYKTIQSRGDHAQLEIDLSGVKQAMAFTKIEGHWLPSDLVENWATARERIGRFLDSLKTPQTKAFLQDFDAQLDHVIADLDRIEKIRSRGKLFSELSKLGRKYAKLLANVKVPR